MAQNLRAAIAGGVLHGYDHAPSAGYPIHCTLPLTGARVVDTIITEMACIRVTPQGLVLEEIAAGLSVAQVQAATEALLIVSERLGAMR